MTVFTCITNQKDNLISVNREDGVRYVCFTDQNFKHPVWEFLPAETYGLCDPRRVARLYKILSHVWFPDEETIWIDGRVQLLKPVKHYLDRYKGIVCARPHHDRNCIYKEAEQVKKLRYDDDDIVDSYINRLEGYPPDNGLHETGMVLRRPGCEEFNLLWWSMVSSGSKRDQLSFDWVAWRLGVKITDIQRAEVRVHRHKRITNKNT